MPVVVVVVGVLAAVSGAGGAVAAWSMHRRSRLSPRNAYLAWLSCVLLTAAAVATQRSLVIAVAVDVLLASTVAAVAGRRWRLAALGAGGELRDHERARVMVWTVLRERRR